MWHVHKTISILLFVFIVQIFTGFGCRENTVDPGGGKGPEFLTAEDIGVTDSYLKITLPFSLRQQPVILKRDTTTIIHSYISANDTLIYDEHLLPNHRYTYILTSSTGRIFPLASALTITTMDTTSHNFRWEIDTLGDGNSSMLNDVFILNDTCVYAVGEIYKRDSLGQWNTDPYNFLRWNGKNWDLKSITYVPLRAVFAFSDTDIWAGSSAPYHWDGRSWKGYNVTGIFGGYINKFWGVTSNNLYMVGTNGSIAHFNGTSWEKLESGTTLDIQDIYGAKNEKTGEWEIIAVAGNYYISNDRKILRISENSATSISDNGINWALNGLWFVPGKQYWVVGDGIWNKRLNLNSSKWDDRFFNITTYVTNRIRGTGITNVFFCGAYGDCFHFNGANWHSYRPQTNLSNGQYLSIAVNRNSAFAVGYDYPRAVIARGYRTSFPSRLEVIH